MDTSDRTIEGSFAVLSNRKQRAVVSLLLLLVALAQIPNLFLPEVDLCDIGNQLAKQQSLTVFHELRGSGGMTLLSDFIGGLWLKVFPAGGLLWMRTGGLVLTCGASLLAFLTLVRFFPWRSTFIVVLTTSSLLSVIAPYGAVVHYYTVPAFLLLLALWMLGCALDVGRGNNSSLRWWAGAGFCLGLSIYARLPLMVVGLFAGGVWLVALWHERHLRARPSLVAGAAFGSGLGLVFFLTLAGLWLVHLQRDFWYSLFFTLGKSPGNDLQEYSFGTLAPKYAVRGIKALILAGSAWVCLAVGQHLFRTIRFWVFLSLCSVTALTLLLVASNGPDQAVMRFREILVGFILIQLVWLWVRCRRQRPEFVWLYCAACAASMAMAFGSTLGLQTATWGMWLALPAAILSAWVALPEHGSGLLRPDPGALTALVIAGVAVCLTCLFLPRRPVWAKELPAARPELLTQYQTAELRWTRGDAELVKAVDSAVNQVTSLVKPGEPCLFFNHIGILYWLTRTRCAFEAPVLYHTRDGVVQWQLQNMERNGRMPHVVVLAVRTPMSPAIKRDICILRQYFHDQHRYRLVAINDFFETYLNVPADRPQGP